MKHDNSTLDVDTRSRRKRHLTRRVSQLVLLAVVSDVLFLLVELVAGLDPLSDFQQHPFLYLYMLLGTIAAFTVFGVVLGSREALLEEMAFRDSLTGLHNSRYLHARLREELASAKRDKRPTSLVLLDIDHFKKVNDQYGHPVGDQVIQFVGRIIQSVSREGEVTARVGGEEFALLLPNTSTREAAAAAERLRGVLGRASIRIGSGHRLAVTVSAGVACANDDGGRDAAVLYRRADQALYRAKDQGRNRVNIETANACAPDRPFSRGGKANVALQERPEVPR